ncbi:hypothetical protein ABK040_004466 [Willaertia magna]
MTNRKDTIFKLAKGFYLRNKNCYSNTKNRVEHALQHSYRGRKEKKRTMHTVWIQNIKAATEQHGVKYSQFIYGLALSGCQINRKILAEIAQTEPLSMRSIVALTVEARKQYGSTLEKKHVEIKQPYEVEFPEEADPEYEKTPIYTEMQRITKHLSKVYSDLMSREYEEDLIYEQKLQKEMQDKKIKMPEEPIIV